MAGLGRGCGTSGRPVRPEAPRPACWRCAWPVWGAAAEHLVDRCDRKLRDPRAGGARGRSGARLRNIRSPGATGSSATRCAPTDSAMPGRNRGTSARPVRPEAPQLACRRCPWPVWEVVSEHLLARCDRKLRDSRAGGARGRSGARLRNICSPGATRSSATRCAPTDSARLGRNRGTSARPARPEDAGRVVAQP